MSEYIGVSSPGEGFSVEFHPHGMLIRGSIPLSAFDGVIKMAADRDPSWTMFDPGLGQALKATFVFGSSESLEAWRAEIEANLAATVPDPIRRWSLGTQTGLSSRWLLACLTGDAAAIPSDRRYLPADAGDFERCSRMLDATGLRPNLHQAGAPWARLLPIWDELEALLARGDRHELNRRLGYSHGR